MLSDEAHCRRQSPVLPYITILQTAPDLGSGFDHLGFLALGPPCHKEAVDGANRDACNDIVGEILGVAVIDEAPEDADLPSAIVGTATERECLARI